MNKINKGKWYEKFNQANERFGYDYGVRYLHDKIKEVWFTHTRYAKLSTCDDGITIIDVDFGSAIVVRKYDKLYIRIWHNVEKDTGVFEKVHMLERMDIPEDMEEYEKNLEYCYEDIIKPILNFLIKRKQDRNKKRGKENE